jgi:hypothetical protein
MHGNAGLFFSSVKKLERIGRSKNMTLVGCDLVGVNAYFVWSSEDQAFRRLGRCQFTIV